MKRLSRLATVGAVAVLGVGVGASTASAYSISGGSYVGTATSWHSWTFAGTMTVTCPSTLTTYSGTATGADDTSFTPSFGGVGDCEFFGYPATVTQSGTWNLKVVAGPDGNGVYEGELRIPTGTTTSFAVPSATCSGAIAGPQAFRDGFSSTVIQMWNTGTGVELQLGLNGVAYTGSGICFPAGSAVYETNGVVDLPGITIS